MALASKTKIDPVVFEDPAGEGAPIRLTPFTVPPDVPDRAARAAKIPAPDPYYVDIGMLYRFAAVERVRRATGEPAHLAIRGHMGTGKDHDVEQWAARMNLPYYRIPMTGEVRDVTLIGSTQLHGDGTGGTESVWHDGDIVRALRGPALLNLSELNAAGAETLFALHGLLDRFRSLDLPNGERVELRDDVRLFATMNPTDLRDYAGTQTLNKAFADRWLIWEKSFPSVDQLTAMVKKRYPEMRDGYVERVAHLAREINASFTALDPHGRVETPMSIRAVLERLCLGLRIYEHDADPLRRSWVEFILPHVDAYDRDHYETVWNAVVRRGPSERPFTRPLADVD